MGVLFSGVCGLLSNMLVLLNERFPHTVSRLCLYQETPPDLKLKIPCLVAIEVDRLRPKLSVKA